MQTTLTMSKGLVVTTGSGTLAAMGGTGLRTGAVRDGSVFHYVIVIRQACACVSDESSDSTCAYSTNSRITASISTAGKILHRLKFTDMYEHVDGEKRERIPATEALTTFSVLAERAGTGGLPAPGADCVATMSRRAGTAGGGPGELDSDLQKKRCRHVGDIQSKFVSTDKICVCKV